MTADADQAPKRPRPKRKIKKKQQQQPSAKAAAGPTPPPKRPRGNQTKYTKAQADEICKRLSQGETLSAICRTPGMPPYQTVQHWVIDDREGFAGEYARARDMGLDHMADALLGISDDGENDTYLDENGNRRTDNDVIQRSKLRVDTRKWYLSKLAPKRYGDKLEVTGSMEITGLDDAALNERLLALLGSIGKGPAKGDAS